jgi:hypothetical protein
MYAISDDEILQQLATQLDSQRLVLSCDDRRLITVLDCIRFEIGEPLSTTRISVRGPDRDWQPIRADFMPFAPLSSPQWLREWLGWNYGRRRRPTPAAFGEAALDRLTHRLYPRTLRMPALQRLRRWLTRTYAIPPAQQEQLFRLWPGGNVCRHQLRCAERFAERLVVLEREAPTLLTAAGVMIAAASVGDTALDGATLKAWWRDAGLSEAGWRQVCRGGLADMLAAWRQEGSAPADLVGHVLLLNALGLLGRAVRPPRTLLAALRRELAEMETLPEPATLANVLLAATRAGMPARRCEVELRRVMDLLHRLPDTHPPPRAGWSWWRRRASLPEIPAASRHLQAVTLPPPGYAGPLGAWCLQPLETLEALISEANRMRHCVGDPNHLQNLALGKARYWSVFDLARQRHLATAMVDAGGEVEVRARCNRPFEEELAFARALRPLAWM